MKATVQREGRLSAWEAAGLALLFLAVGAWGAAATAVAIVAAAPHVGGALGSALAAVGPDRIMRRCLMGWAALFIAVLLWRGGWRGWRDCGFVADDPGAPGRPWWGQVLIGISLGLVTMGGLSLLTLLLDLRIVTPVATASEGLRRALSFIGSGITVALVEETVCRGMLFRVLARSWSVWPAAAATSLLFALAHFLSPDPRSFQGASFLQASFSVLVSTYATLVNTPSALLVFVNLALLGIVLCGFVARTRTVWLAVGAHAAWVWVIKFFHLWTEVAPGIRPTPWLGARSDFMDSFVVTLLMVVLIAWGFRRLLREESVIVHGGFCWRVAPEDRVSLQEWLERYYPGDAPPATRRPAPPGDGFKGGGVLKDHHGSRVIALGGRIVKSYGPKPGWTRFRFAFRPSRTRRAFLLARDLLALGIPTPRPLAWTLLRRFGLLRGESLVVEEAVGCERLTDGLARNERDPAARARIMAAYGHLTARFHQAGYSNRDMKHDNIMGSTREPWKLQVIDLDGVRYLGRITCRRAGRDLMRVGQSLASRGWAEETDVRMFFEAYNAGVPPRLHRQSFPPETR